MLFRVHMQMDILAEHQRMLDRFRDAGFHVEMASDEEGNMIWRIIDPDGKGYIGFVHNIHPEDIRRIRNGLWEIRPRNHDVVVAQPQPTDRLKEIETWLHARYPELNNMDFETNALIYGRVQQGKTGLILANIWIAQNIEKIRCVLGLANMTGSYNQVLGKNAIEFNHELRRRFGDGYGLKMVGMRDGVIAPADHTLVFMMNPSQLRRAVELLNGEKYIFFMDEADIAVKGVDESSDASKTGPLCNKLMDDAMSIVQITATPVACMNQSTTRQQKTIRMTPRADYRSIRETEWKMVDPTIADAIRKGSIRETLDLVQEIVQARLPLVIGNGRRYMSILINATTTMAKQAITAKALARTGRYGGVYVMNSDGNCLIKRAMRNRLVPTGMNSISLLYDEFEAEARRFPERSNVYIIIGHQTASRAISFRPTTARNGTGGLHAMILLPSLISHCAQLIQYMRIFGNYAADYPRILCATTDDVYRRLDAEIHHNLEVLAEKTAEMGDSRKLIEGSVMIDTRRHDRPAVDDTVLLNKRFIHHQDFDSMETLLECLPADLAHLPRRWMTDKEVKRIETPADFHYTHVRTKQMEFLQQFHHQIGVRRIHIAWDDPRYEDLHNIRRRFGKQRKNYLGDAIVGDGVNADHLYSVRWKPEFCSDELTIDDHDFWSSAVFLFRTSRGKYRFYHDQATAKMGILGR